MKNILPKWLLVILLFTSYSIFSQEIRNEEIINQSTSITQFDSRSKNLEGTQYITEEFLPAKLMNNDEIYSVRFNAYQDEMEIKRNGQDYSLPKTFDYSITFLNDQKIYRVFEYRNNNVPTKGFFIVVYSNDKVSLLVKEKIVLMDEVNPKTGYEKYKPPTLKREKDKLYIAYKNNTTTELPTKKKDFYNLFSSKSKEVEAFISDNNLNIKDTEDLIQIFEYYNTLN